MKNRVRATDDTKDSHVAIQVLKKIFDHHRKEVFLRLGV